MQCPGLALDLVCAQRMCAVIRAILDLMSTEESRLTGPHANRNYGVIEYMEEEEEEAGFSVLHSIVEVLISQLPCLLLVTGCVTRRIMILP